MARRRRRRAAVGDHQRRHRAPGAGDGAGHAMSTFAGGGAQAAPEAAAPGMARLIAVVFMPFAGGYFLSYLFRSINAVIAPQLTSGLGLTAADPIGRASCRERVCQYV